MAEPTELPKWDENETNVEGITTEQEGDGFPLKNKPASGTFNTWMRNVYKWTEWFQEKFTQAESVDSIADLRAITFTPEDGQVVHVTGYYSSVENQYWSFQWDPSNLTTEVAADTKSIFYVALDVDLTGATGAWVRLWDNSTVNVRWAGAKGDGATNDYEAIQACFDLLKGDDATGGNRTAQAVYLPMPEAGKSYATESTLVVDGTHSGKIYSDAPLTIRSSAGGAGYTLMWNSTAKLPVIQIKGGTGTPSNPNFHLVFENIGILGRPTFSYTTSEDVALAGFYIGNLDSVVESSLMRMLTIRNCVVSNARFGFYSGSPENQNTDHANMVIENSEFTINYQQGIHSGTGNSILMFNNSQSSQNGFGSATYAADGYSPQIGSNVFIEAGYVFLNKYVSAGADTLKPVDADIYQLSGGCSIDGAWSDTEGLFYDQRSATLNGGTGYQIGTVESVRHFSGTMDGTNTPNSMAIRVPGTSVSSCNVYGNIDIISGSGGAPIFSGIQFIRAGATFTGSGVETQRSLINIGNAENNAQILMGGTNATTPTPLSSIGSVVPQLLSVGTGQAGIGQTNSILQWLGADVADSSGTMGVSNFADGSLYFLINCYTTGSGTFTANVVTQGCIRITISPLTGVETSLYDPVAGANFLEADWVQAGFVTKAGLGDNYREQAVIMPPKAAADPTFSSGDYWEGGLYYNTTTNKLRLNTGTTTWVDLN